MRNLKRFASMCLALALVVSIAGVTHFMTSANADSYDAAKVKLFTDIDNHWARTSLANLIGYGYMHGVGDNKAAPNDKLTTAQLVTLLVRIMGGAEEADMSNYVDVDKDSWCYTYFAQGISMGIVPNTNSNYLNPSQASSREYAAYMLCRAFGLTVREPIDGYSDADKVSDWAVSSMQAMVAAKAITGSNGSNSGRNLNPQETITRGEFAEMVYRLCKNFIKDGDSTNVRGGTMDGGVLISKGGVHMNGTTVKGNVYVSDAVGTGDVTLEDVKVEGNIYVRGSGERSIHLEGDTTANSVVFLNPYNATRLVVEDDAKINGVLINNGVDEVTLEGNVGNVTMNVSDVDLTLEKAVASNVVINSARSTITVEDDAKVETLSIASSSNGVTVDNKGELKRLALMANNAKLNLDGKLDYLLIGAVEGLELDLSKDITLGALDLHCSDSTITVDSDVKTINVSAFSEKLKLELGKNAKVLAVGISSASTDLAVDSAAEVGTVTLDAPKYKGKVTSDLKSLTIGAGATEAELTLAKDTDIDTLTINASKVKLIAESGSTVKNVNVTGSECSVTGQGAVAAVNLSETANKSSVETPNTKVSNAGASEVKAGTVDLPANKVYVTTSTGKDVIRNNDGTPDGDNDKTTGASQEVATVANFELTFAANAMANDLDPSGKWKLDDLVSGITLTKNTTGQGASYRLTGNVKKVDNFLPVFDPIAGYGTGYYVPVIVNAESMAKETGYEVVSNGTRYTSANLSKGTGYPGKLIAYLQLQSGTTNKIATISFDRDGAGNTYSPVTVSIDYSGMTFDGAQDLTGELFSYPVNATKADLTKDSKYALTDFGKFNIAKSGASSYTVSGTATYIEGTVNGNTGAVQDIHHYLPLMINTSAFNSGWTVVVNGTDRYNASNVSNGTGCRGHLIVLLPMSASVGGTNTIYLDTDGDGRVDNGGTYTISCTSVALAVKGAVDPNKPVEYLKEFVTIPDYITVVANLENGVSVITDKSKDGTLAKMDDKAKMLEQAALYVASKMHSMGCSSIYLEKSTDEDEDGKTFDVYWVHCTFADTTKNVLVAPHDIEHKYEEPGEETVSVKITVPVSGSLNLKEYTVDYPKSEQPTIQELIDYLVNEDGQKLELGTYFYEEYPSFDKFAPVSSAGSVKASPDAMYFFGYTKVSLAEQTATAGGLTATSKILADSFANSESRVFTNSTKTEAYVLLGTQCTVSLAAPSIAATTADSRFMLTVNGATIRLKDSLPSLSTSPVDGIASFDDKTSEGAFHFVTQYDERGKVGYKTTALDLKFDTTITGEFSLLLRTENLTPAVQPLTVRVMAIGSTNAQQTFDVEFENPSDALTLRDVMDAVEERDSQVKWGTHFVKGSAAFANVAAVSTASTVEIQDGDQFTFSYVPVTVADKEQTFGGIGVKASFDARNFTGGAVFNADYTQGYIRLGTTGKFTITVNAGTTTEAGSFAFTVSGATISGPTDYNSVTGAPTGNTGVSSLTTAGSTVIMVTAYDTDNRVGEEVKAFTFEVPFAVSGELSYNLTSGAATA